MLPLVDKPLIQYTVEKRWLLALKDIIVITGRGKRGLKITSIVPSSWKKIERHRQESGAPSNPTDLEPRELLLRAAIQPGLGHAVLCAQHLIGDEPFAVILGMRSLTPMFQGLHN